MQNLQKLFKEHLQICMQNAAQSLADLNYSSLILGSGKPFTYFCDDSDAPFRSNPHFAHWCPAPGPHHFIKYTPGEEKPHLLYYHPQDYWHDHEPLARDLYWAQAFKITEIDDLTELESHLGNTAGAVFIGNNDDFAKFRGLKANCELMSARLNWYRRYKSEYEIFCLSEANRIASLGHRAAKEAFLNGDSEYEISCKYLQAMRCVDEDMPYGSIIGLNQNSAILHYRAKKHIKNGTNLLIDAGARFAHYGSDITRSYAAPHCDPLFAALIQETEAMQQSLCRMVKVGASFLEISNQTHLKIAEILEKLGVIRVQGNYQEAMQNGITKAFFPHRLGHMLGIQVHDIGGRQADLGDKPTNPALLKYLAFREIPKLEKDMVITIEPGIYFIPLLLENLKNSPAASQVDWEVVARLLPFGGVRIEDDVVVTQEGPRNLTREFLPD